MLNANDPFEGYDEEAYDPSESGDEEDDSNDFGFPGLRKFPLAINNDVNDDDGMPPYPAEKTRSQ